MQYVRSISGSVSKTWSSINPATLSGAIDVIVVEHDDGSLACSPFHVRFGKLQLLRPYEKTVEFRVNGVKQDLAMKLGEGGEAFFVFETSEDIPASMKTSPPVSPSASPRSTTCDCDTTSEVLEPLDLNNFSLANGSSCDDELIRDEDEKIMMSNGSTGGINSAVWMEFNTLPRVKGVTAAGFLQAARRSESRSETLDKLNSPDEYLASEAANCTGGHGEAPAISLSGALTRAVNLAKRLKSSNISSRVTETGDLMLDMRGYKSSEEDALRAEIIARKILADELEGNFDIGALIGIDELGNIWIYSSEEAKEAAELRASQSSGSARSAARAWGSEGSFSPGASDSESASGSGGSGSASRCAEGENGCTSGGSSLPGLPTVTTLSQDESSCSSKSYAKTLRLTSKQLKLLLLKPGPNSMSFTVNRATCQAFMYYWRHDVPIVISDIDGTITKSDALGHVLNMIGRDWTHQGVAKLYTDIAANGYNILYLTSRSVGQADSTRGYLNGVVQDGYKLPRGPVILSPDRTIAALRREVYLRKPEVFKMACLRDIMGLFYGAGWPSSKSSNVSQMTPFYAGFGNRLTDALSYRSVNIPSTRIFTINSNAEVSLDLLSLNKFKTGYVSMREIVDHYFPPVSLLVKREAEPFTDFNYWREGVLDVTEFTASETSSEVNEDELLADEEYSEHSELPDEEYSEHSDFFEESTGVNDESVDGDGEDADVERFMENCEYSLANESQRQSSADLTNECQSTRAEA